MDEKTHNYMALDFGAESGRAIIVSLKENIAALEEIHRFPNKPALMNGTLFWDLPFLFREIITSLKKAALKGIQLESIAVDTWGVDFGLLDLNDELISNPVHYRDNRTLSIKDLSPVSDESLFQKTGGLPWNIASLFQLFSMKMKESNLLKASGTFLNMPDLFNFLLCGKKASEITIASTSIIMDTDKQWNQEILDNFQLPHIFPDIVYPATFLAPLKEELVEITGNIYKNLKVFTTCSHDTASVAAIVPDRSESSAFLSSGTWSILGKIFDDPQTDLTIFEQGFTNEASLDSWYLCKNITGLYPFQELKRFWDLSDNPWGYERMCKEAAASELIGLVDLEHKDFHSPGDIKEKIDNHLERNDYHRVIHRGEAARVILESLAHECALNLKKLEKLSRIKIRTLYILGGGIKNSFLCQRTADLCGVTVIAGIDQGTALGNGLVQAYGQGHVNSTEAIRKIATDSFEMKTYIPESNSETENQLNIYRALKDRSDKV